MIMAPDAVVKRSDDTEGGKLDLGNKQHMESHPATTPGGCDATPKGAPTSIATVETNLGYRFLTVPIGKPRKPDVSKALSHPDSI